MLNIIYKNTSIILDIVKYIVHKNVTFSCIYIYFNCTRVEPLAVYI